MTTTAKETSLSIRAACAVIDGEGFGQNAMMAVLQSLKDAGKIKRNEFQGASVMLSDLKDAMKALA